MATRPKSPIQNARHSTERVRRATTAAVYITYLLLGVAVGQACATELPGLPAPPAVSNPAPAPVVVPAARDNVHEVVHTQPGEPFVSQGTARGLLVRLPVADPLPDGTVWLTPNVEVLPSPMSGPMGPPLGIDGSMAGGEYLDPQGAAPWNGPGVDGLPMWDGEIPAGADQAICGPCDAYGPCPGVGGAHCRPRAAEPLFGRVLQSVRGRACDPCGPFEPVCRVLSPANCSGDIGVGRSRLPYAPFEVDVSQPQNNYRLRLDFADNLAYPDRSEYFWAAPRTATAGVGTPAADIGLDYQDYRMLIEVGGEVFSTATEMVIRSLDPVYNANTTGLADMNLATKLVMFDGKRWQITQLFRTHFNIGAKGHGLSTAHISLEPGLLFTYRYSPITLLHAEAKYWFPIAGNPDFSGQVMRLGLAYSHLMMETDAFAVIHTGEFISHCFLDGFRSAQIWNPILGEYELGTVPVDGDSSFQYYPGLRFVADTGGDCGMFEFGMAGTFSLGQNDLYDSLLRFDFRWSY
jgi:hypothetical protein